MIISVEEFLEMGFSAENGNEQLLEDCIKRAEFVLNGLTNGRAGVIALAGNAAADFVKQAAAFQANEILKEELARTLRTGGESTAAKSEERVSIGDFSYSSGTSSSKSQKSGGGSAADKPLDAGMTIARLLRAAGCFYGGTEVIL